MTRPRWRCQPTPSGRCPLEATLRLSSQDADTPEDGADPQTRTVKENSPPGTNVGKPVTAGDSVDVLTYTISGTDAGLYVIDRLRARSP